MKKILSVVLLLMLSVALYAQDNVTKFLGIPVDGTKSSMIRKIEKKGFVYNEDFGCLQGEFNGKEVSISIGTNKNKVWRIIVSDKTWSDAGQIKIRYNKLCRQFAENPRYMPVSIDTLPKIEEMESEITVHKKRYEALYYQLPFDSNIRNRFVWFTIFPEKYDLYSIAMYYENRLNMANGEDL